MRLSELQPGLAEHLKAVEEVLKYLASAEHPLLQEGGAQVVSGRGKRLRPAVVLLSAQACGEVTPQTISVAAITELLHTASLIHDDILDESAFRRGEASAWVRWGNKISVLLGDYLLCRTVGHVVDVGTQEMQADLLRVAAEMCIGQVMEILGTGPDLTEERYLAIIGPKTASLFGLCGRLGAASGGAAPAVVAALGRFGYEFGMAFQIADDILDLSGDEEDSGKPRGRDLDLRKMTLPLIHTLEVAETDRKIWLAGIIREGDFSDGQIRQVRDVVRAHQGIDYAWSVCQRYLEQARRELDAVPDSPAKATLVKVAAEAFPLPVMA